MSGLTKFSLLEKELCGKRRTACSLSQQNLYFLVHTGKQSNWVLYIPVFITAL